MLAVQWLQDRYNKLTQKYSTVWVAYSGGVDSHVLLHLAHNAIPNVRVVHINHNLNAADHVWQQHCQNICQQLNIPITCIKVDARPVAGQSHEEAARIARRKAWENLLQPNDLLILAHHADDQAETILYRLMRGAGPQGLSGMRKISKLGMAHLWRPLLSINKQQIIEYAATQQLNWLQDHSNSDNAFDRNFIRNTIMPRLQQRWPHAAVNINRAGKMCQRLQQCVDPILQEKLTFLINHDQTLNWRKLRFETKLWQQHILRAWLQRHALNPTAKHIQTIMREIINARNDARPRLIIADKAIQRSKYRLHVLEHRMIQNAAYDLVWDLTDQLLLPNGKYLQPEQISSKKEFMHKLALHTVTVRSGILGRKAKKIFQQHSIPHWERTQYPLVFADDRLVSIIGLWCSNRF
jgi:tRNA(Ile)-lysidine synthase